jgi:hypothetical protein
MMSTTPGAGTTTPGAGTTTPGAGTTTPGAGTTTTVTGKFKAVVGQLLMVLNKMKFRVATDIGSKLFSFCLLTGQLQSEIEKFNMIFYHQYKISDQYSVMKPFIRNLR